ncbi:MAG: hypothetical protein ACYTGX_15410 [Planctomycetota bacterium]|jgi:hypothetical protein
MKMQKLMLVGVALAGLSMTGCHHLIHRRVHHDVRHGHRRPVRRTTHVVHTSEPAPPPRKVVVVKKEEPAPKPKKKVVKPKPPHKALEKRHKKHKKGLKKLFGG